MPISRTSVGAGKVRTSELAVAGAGVALAHGGVRVAGRLRGSSGWRSRGPRMSSTTQSAGMPGNASAGTARAVTFATRPLPRTCPTRSVARRIGCHPATVSTTATSASARTIERIRKAIVPRVRSPVYAPVVPPHQRRRSRVRSRSGGAGATRVGVTSQVPQRRQNRRVGSLAVPQLPQVRCSGAALLGGARDRGEHRTRMRRAWAAPAVRSPGGRTSVARSRRTTGADGGAAAAGPATGPVAGRTGGGGAGATGGRGAAGTGRPPGCRSSRGNRRSSRRTVGPPGCWCRSCRTPPRPSNPPRTPARAGDLPTLRRRLPAAAPGNGWHHRRVRLSVRMATVRASR